MPILNTHHDFQALQKLSFCYLCGQTFDATDVTNRDHIPPRTIFLKTDRAPTLWLPTHKTCNSAQTVTDEKIGQLIALRYGKVPPDPSKRRLQIIEFQTGQAAVANLEVDAAVWRWIRGFHAALYREPYVDPNPEAANRSLVTPFPRAPKTSTGIIELEPVRPQHAAFVEKIKLNRVFQNIDRIVSNNGKLTYECVWYQCDDDGPWMCLFAVNIYDWKDLGKIPSQPARGCAGFYVMDSGLRPSTATIGTTSKLIVPNYDPLDPFAQ